MSSKLSRKSNKHSKRSVSKKVLKEFERRNKSQFAKTMYKKKSKKSKALNISMKTKDLKSTYYNYKIISTVFEKKDKNIYSPYSLWYGNVTPNLVIELKSKQNIIVYGNHIKYLSDGLENKNVVLKPFSVFSILYKNANLINLNKVTNKTNENQSLCLKTNIPCNIEILKIKKLKNYFINPLNIMAFSENIQFETSKFKFTVRNNIFMILLNLIFFIPIAIFTRIILIPRIISKSYNFNFIKTSLKKDSDKHGDIFLSCYGGTNHFNFKDNPTIKFFKVPLGQLVAFDENVKIVSINNLIKTNLSNKAIQMGIPSDNEVVFSGTGTIYYQTINYFEYAFAQMNMFDDKWVKQMKNEKKLENETIQKSLRDSFSKNKSFQNKLSNVKQFENENLLNKEFVGDIKKNAGKYMFFKHKSNIILLYEYKVHTGDNIYMKQILFNVYSKGTNLYKDGEPMHMFFLVKKIHNPFVLKSSYTISRSHTRENNILEKISVDTTGNYIIIFLKNPADKVDTFLYKFDYIGKKKVQHMYSSSGNKEHICEIIEQSDYPKNITFENLNKSEIKKVQSNLKKTIELL